MSDGNGLKAYSTLHDLLAAEGWDPQPVELRYALRSKRTLGNRWPLDCYFQVLVDIEEFVFYAVPQFSIPSDRRLLVAEYIVRANYGLRVGNFEMNFADGKIRYKSGISFAGETLTPGLILQAVNPSLETLIKYLPGIVAVVETERTPGDVINEIEKDDFYISALRRDG